MSDQIPRRQAGRMAGVLREQLNEMMAAAQELGELLSMSEKGREYLAVINRGLCRQLRLARHLELEHRLTSEDEIRLVLEPVDVVVLCEELLAQVESVTYPLGQTLIFRTALPELVMSADRERLEDMLLCLLSNAVKAAGEGGKVELVLERRGDRVIFLLSDNGKGLDSAALAEFFGQEDDTEEPSPGSGLGQGLPLARRIAGLHGGAIIADSYEDRGTRLAVALPYQDPDQPVGLSGKRPTVHEEGWNKVLIELSDSLPAKSFLPEELDG